MPTPAIFTFFTYPDVTADNNRNEHELRPMATDSKVTGGFRSGCGADLCAAVRFVGTKELGWQNLLAGPLFQFCEIGIWIASEAGAQDAGMAPLAETAAEFLPLMPIGTA